MWRDDLLYIMLMRIFTIIVLYCCDDSLLCVFVFGLNATRVSGDQSESHAGKGEA